MKVQWIHSNRRCATSRFINVRLNIVNDYSNCPSISFQRTGIKQRAKLYSSVEVYLSVYQIIIKTTL